MNGYILLFHLGSDKRRRDKFYTRLESLLSKLLKEDYEFVDLYKATDTDENNSTTTVKNKKRKN
jgi:hypothetical protein